jgi:hypothetical protein
MTRADRELLLSLHAKVDALLARFEPDIDHCEGALVTLLHDSFDTDQFTRRDVIERASISPALTRALLDCDVDAKSDMAMHELKYALRRMKGTRVGDLHLWNDGNGRWQFMPTHLTPWQS